MRTALTDKELAQFLKDMELGTEQTVMAIDGLEDSVMPDLAMGVIKDKYFDSDTTTYLVGVYGNDTDFMSFFSGDYDDEDICIENVINWFIETGNAFCGLNFGGLYIKPTDEEENQFYEENKYNGEIARTVPDTFLFGDIDLVARFDVEQGNFYDCYQKEDREYLGELHTENLDALTDQEISDMVEEIKYGHVKAYVREKNRKERREKAVRTIDTDKWGEVYLVSAYDGEQTFYNCYQKSTDGFLGELYLEYETTLDDYTDKDIETSINEDMQIGW